MNNTNPKIIVVGSTNVDFCSHVARLPRPGETIGGGKFMQASGGKGANQAVAAARLGGDVNLSRLLVMIVLDENKYVISKKRLLIVVEYIVLKM